MSEAASGGIAKRWKEIDRLYDEALGLALAERTRFLTEACGADTELVETVSRLLEAGSRAELAFSFGFAAAIERDGSSTAGRPD